MQDLLTKRDKTIQVRDCLIVDESGGWWRHQSMKMVQAFRNKAVTSKATNEQVDIYFYCTNVRAQKIATDSL